MLTPYLLILSSKERINYSKLKLITFFTGIVIIVMSEGIIRFVSKELMNNIYISITPFVIFAVFYSIFIYKLNFKTYKT